LSKKGAPTATMVARVSAGVNLKAASKVSVDKIPPKLRAMELTVKSTVLTKPDQQDYEANKHF